MQERLLKPQQIEVAAGPMPVNLSGWTAVDDKVLILPDVVGLQSNGGVHLPDDIRERQEMAVTRGIIVEVGPNAFHWTGDRMREWSGRKPKPGDGVVFERYAGQNLTGDDGRTYRLMDDKCIGAVRVE